VGPRVGIDVSFSFGDAIVTALPPAMCAPIAAAVDRHNKWFDGDDTAPPIKNADSAQKYAASSQQAGERVFLDSIIPKICANPDQSDHEFTKGVLDMLDEVRTHINRHTHAAFYIKDACSLFDEPCLNTTDLILGQPPATGHTKTYSQSILCFAHVLEHENYNVAEGFAFVNVSMTLLGSGPSFCQSPDLEATVAEMRDQLETTMAYHRSNNLFKQLSDGHMENYCTADDISPSYDEVYDVVSEQIDAAVMAKPNCTFEAETAKKMTWMTSNPPAAVDLVHVFETNTQIAMLTAAQLVADVLGDEMGCVDSETGEPDQETTASILADFQTTQLPGSMYEEMEDKWGLQKGQTFFDPAGGFLYGQLGIPSVYHKLAFSCIPEVGVNSSLDRSFARAHGLYNRKTGEVDAPSLNSLGMIPGNSVPQRANCILNDGTTMTPTNAGESPVFDIGPSTDISKCSGDKCRKAATATLNYQQFLGTLTSFRWETILAGGGGTKTEGDKFSQDTWTFQRTCSSMQQIVDGLKIAQTRLPSVVNELKASSSELDALCVAPARDFVTNEAVSVLGEAQASSNAATWTKGGKSPFQCIPPAAYLPHEQESPSVSQPSVHTPSLSVKGAIVL